MLNLTNSSITSPEFIKVAHEVSGAPSAVIMYFGLLAVLIVGGGIVGAESRKLWGIVLFTAIVGGIILLGIVNMPFTVQSIADFFRAKI